MSYESPISITNQIVDKIRTDFDDKIMDSIQIQTSIKVDKQELVKALQYDREQYQKGYEEGKRDAVRHGYWVGRNNPDAYEYPCSICGKKELYMNAAVYEFCPHCGAKMDEKENN